ncbi:hypothetical protein NIES4072_31360 [Nostoc commune NIES-4072]|uniref:Uncharacterized protein n=1 Tax=Nostoc commune NIES-4072 TaxID=2005467 RepID=A0A2R5FPR0_NOSCO|nr:hypothetical protein [Nostoc commune]BBD69531.1 hypothetical protein NIES4070_59400 [Nostoc commune HK-02]GBG19468.1 hypothetical protein NIES4072_31360 [Nostoc commune NIES-4072]
MTVNQSARNVRLLIGGTDYTPCLISFQGSDSHLDQSGLITFTGQILLGKALGFNQSLDDRKSPGSFCRGKSVTLDIADTNGSLTRHPRGTLRILTPKYDTEKQQLTLEVADLITLLNFKEPTDPDKADNKSSGSSTATSVITKLLHEAGINNFTGNLPDTLYNYPLNLSGSYLQSVGKLLYANNKVGWIDNQERFRVSTVNVESTQSLISLIVGKNELWYRRLGGAESPCEKIKAVGTQMVTREIELDSTVTTEQYGSPAILDPESTGLIVINKVTETQKWDEDEGKFTITSVTEKPWGLIVARAFWDNFAEEPNLPPELFRLFLGESRIEESSFESVTAGGKLIQKTTIFNTDKSQYLAEIQEARPDFIVGNYVGLTNTKNVTETYTYSPKEVVVKKVTQTQELAVIVLNGSNENWDDWDTIPEYFVTSEYKSEEWKEIDKYTWQYETYTLKPTVKAEGGTAIEYPDDVNIRAKQKLGLTWDSSEKRRSNSGQETPPAAERRPTTKRLEENPVTYTAYFQDSCSGNFKQRERTYNVEFLAGIIVPYEKFFISSDSGANKQLEAIARREGRLLRGRWQGQEMAGAIPNSLLGGYEPLFGVNVLEFDGTGQNYLADGCSWVVTAQKALWSCDGIWVGESQSAIPVRGVISITSSTLTINGANVRGAVITPDGSAVVGNVTITPDGNTIINGVTLPADGNVVIPGTTILPYTEIEPIPGGMALGIEFKSYAYLLTITSSEIQLGLGESGQWSSGFVLPAGIGIGANFTGDFISSLYWEDFDWDGVDESAWNSLQPSPTWESVIWDEADWDRLL